MQHIMYLNCILYFRFEMKKSIFFFNLNFFEYQYGLEIQYEKSIKAGHEKIFLKYIKSFL